MVIKMKIAVCDDEKMVREDIAGKIKRLYPEAELYLYEDGEKLLKSGEAFDIIFLDIQMDGINGMEAAKKLRESEKGKDAVLIFVTALDEYVYQAFDVEAFHYLVKPFQKAKFYEVLNAAVKKCGQNRQKTFAKEEKSISIKIGRVTSKVYVKDIIYAEVFNRKIILHSTDGELEFYGRMNDLEKELGEDFFRPHRAYLVQLRYVSSYNATSILLENGQRIIMAKQKYEEFVKCYFQYVRKDDK
ncbi:MAG: LytTR family DNA-binding domain-containing protein [Bacillus sp. (in: Bacteria)]|nr:LytTR family DNA-binding domain-containing protein [Bacillus sp. (in: firmicutes)]MCM1426088.1 LytTR family DNA-binding domain-containing protein [Eubacterium sp.]